MKIAFVVLSLAILSSCNNDALYSSATNNNQIKVDFLFDHGGCKVYRFRDGRDHYFTNCTETISSNNCGKACEYEENIKTKKEQK